MSAPRLLETMRAHDGQIALLDRHLSRLTASADTLGFDVDPDAVRRRVEAEPVGEGLWGVRLTLGAGGDLEVRSWALEDAPFRTVWIDPDPFCDAGGGRGRHKTTAREAYRERVERARERGADEAILVNPDGKVSEGARTTVWAEIDGRWWTPPLTSGGLPGVYRAYVLDTTPEAGERVLRPSDLGTARALALSNALRGWMPVTLVRP